MTSGPARHEFGIEEIADLLSHLDERLRERAIGASVFVVGGAAVAAAGLRSGRLTEDVDAIYQHRAVHEEATALALARGIPEDWLNSSARMWMPPMPAGVLDDPERPGLRVTYADAGFLLATKLVAQRAKDADDVVALARSLGMRRPTEDQLLAHIRRYDTDAGALEFIVEGNDVDAELAFLARDAAKLLRDRG